MNIEEKVKCVLAELSGEEDISNEATLQNDLSLDSISMVMLLVGIEDNFKIQLDETDMNPLNFDTVQSVIDMVEKYVGDEDE